jgi:hypothetical protein
VKPVTLLVTVVGVAMLLTSGGALAATFDGTPGPHVLVGTPVKGYTACRIVPTENLPTLTLVE